MDRITGTAAIIVLSLFFYRLSAMANEPVNAAADVTANVTTTRTTYTPSTGIIANPERGFYRDATCSDPLNLALLRSYRIDEGYTLLHCYFRLDAYANTAIAAGALATLQDNLDLIRNAGLKAILRFTYNMTDNAVDANPVQLAEHLQQLAPYLENNKDIIAVVQAGFIGSWGEWAHSSHYGTDGSLTAQNWSDRTNFLNDLLQAVPPERMVQLRTPHFKRTIFGATALSASEAYSGTARARVGHHNDCFLASSDDWGTYRNRFIEQPYLSTDTMYLPMGGETCNHAPPRSDCDTALKEMARFHWSYVNLDYHQAIISDWKSQGCFNRMQQKLGYRFVLLNGAYSASAKPGGFFRVSFTVENQGWAAPFNRRDVELILRHASSGALYRFKLITDPRQWLAGRSTTIEQNVLLPADIPKGNYAVLLNLSDPMRTLNARPEYSIQLANTGVWEAGTGFNDLGHVVNVMP